MPAAWYGKSIMSLQGNNGKATLMMLFLMLTLMFCEDNKQTMDSK